MFIEFLKKKKRCLIKIDLSSIQRDLIIRKLLLAKTYDIEPLWSVDVYEISVQVEHVNRTPTKNEAKNHEQHHSKINNLIIKKFSDIRI